jgi:hypothetical protein
MKKAKDNHMKKAKDNHMKKAKDNHTKKTKDNITLKAKELFQTKSLKINKELCFVHTINYFPTLQLGSYNIQIYCLYLCRMLTT